ncbi:MAG: Mor transcription activator family protein [Luteibacter sp.]
MTSESIDLFEDAPTDPSQVDIEPSNQVWPSTLAEIIEVLRTNFIRQGRTESEAVDDAKSAALALSTWMGGRQIYIPNGERVRRAIRDRIIYLEYNGRNKGTLATRYRLTERAVERIAAEQRAIHVRKIQPDMFATQETKR